MTIDEWESENVLGKKAPKEQGSTNCAHGDERARKEVIACTKLRARNSIKTPLGSTPCYLRLSYLCLKANNIRGNNI